MGDEALLAAVRRDLAEHGLAPHAEDRREEPDQQHHDQQHHDQQHHDQQHHDQQHHDQMDKRRNDKLDQRRQYKLDQRPEDKLDQRNSRGEGDRGLRPSTRERSDRRRIQGPSPGADAERPGLKKLLSTGIPAPAGRRLSDATIARLGATLLWVLVIVAAYGGVTAWLRPSPSASAEQTVADPGDVLDGRWAAAGFAERYVGAYLAAGSDGALLAPYLGYTPDLPAAVEPASVTEPLRVVEVVRGHDERTEYWSVTVAVGDPDPATLNTEGDVSESGASDDGDNDGDIAGASESDDGTSEETAASDIPRPGGEAFWQVAVDTSGTQPVAASLPALVPGPAAPDRLELALSLRTPPRNEPMVESVQGFLASYLCGGADLDRYVHPDYVHPTYEVVPVDDASDGDRSLVPADPPLCAEVKIDRWADAPAREIAGSTASSSDEERRTVIAEVTYDTGSDARRGTHALTLAQRDGRWEVAALLPAPPLEERR